MLHGATIFANECGVGRHRRGMEGAGAEESEGYPHKSSG